MRIIYTCIFLFVCLNLAIAQPPADWFPGPNLVPNPGFEDLRRGLPANDLDGSIAFRNCSDKWMSPTKGTPDLQFHINGGYDQTDNPRTGKAMVAILTHNPESKRSDTYREYIQVRLDQPLKEGSEYYVEFWTKRSIHSKMTSNNIGLALSPVPTLNQDWNPLTEIHTIVNTDEIINPKGPEWVKVAAKFTASNRERFLIIGNFFDNDNTTFGKAPNPTEDGYANAYYLVDDVGLWQIGVEPEEAPEPEPEIETLATKSVEVGQIIRLDRIYFAFDKWDLLPASYEELDELLLLLNKYPSMKIAIHGHTDSRGSDTYNYTLSENRSQSVYKYLLNRGIALDRIQYEGFGEGRPIAGHETEEDHQMNRRVEFVVLELGAENVSIENVTDEN